MDKQPNLGVEVKTKSSERKRNKVILFRIFESIIFSAIVSIFFGLNKLTAIIAFIWVIGEIIVQFVEPEDLIIELIINYFFG